MSSDYVIKHLTQAGLKNVDFGNVVYGERSQSGAMGNAGGIILYVLENETLTRYETNVFKDKETAVESLKKITTNESLFNLYYGGMGNGVFVSKRILLDIDKENSCFWVHDNNKKYRIDSSVPGVFLKSSDHMIAGKPGGLHALQEGWEQSLRDLFLED